jgi:transcriptional regulator with XRE-family HTH domain
VRSLRLFREARGINQTQLAELVGDWQPSIAAYERGRRVPPAQRLDAIAEAVGTTPDELRFTERVLDALVPEKKE